MNMTTVALNELRNRKPEMLAWGFRFLVDSEIEAHRIGYAYRNNPHGYKIEPAGDAQKFSVTIWNATAKAMGCDT